MIGLIILGIVLLFLAVLVIRALMFHPKPQPKLTAEPVDFDKDGIFEATEFYSVDSDKKMNFHSLEDERQIVKNLFGLPAENAEFYLKMIQIDRDKDTVPDFTEEYLENNGKISSWDADGDGKWNVRHVVYPDGISEESMFYTVPEKNLVVVRFENNVPQKVTNGKEEFFIVIIVKTI